MGPLGGRCAPATGLGMAGVGILLVAALGPRELAPRPTLGSFLSSETQPLVRVALAVDAETITASSPAGLTLSDALTGQPAGTAGPSATVRVSAHAGILRIADGLSASPEGVPSVLLRPSAPGAPIVLNGKPYRGTAEVRVSSVDRVTTINVLPLEEYLLGVVPLEIGPRGPEEVAAVEAQAVAARTYAVAHLGRQSELGFDLHGTVQDQVYGGMQAEREESTLAIRNTAGQVLMFDGRPIRAFYHSTCGGRTAPVEEVMDREPAPYLRSIVDQAPDGTSYCAASPRYRWSVTWTPAELDRVARRELADHFGVPADNLGEVRSVEVLSHTESGRVKELAFRGPGVDLVVSRLDIRRALPAEARILSSTDFTVHVTSDGLVELHGRGYGHGAGMCQWGAIGRARAGKSYRDILNAYYPGAILVNVYTGDQG